MESGHTQVSSHRLKHNLIQVASSTLTSSQISGMYGAASSMQLWINDHNKCKETVSMRTDWVDMLAWLS